MPVPTVLILYNEPVLPPDHPDADSEHDVLYTADVIGRNLKKCGLAVRRLGVSNDISGLLSGLKSLAPDVIFNLYEGTAEWGDTEVYVAGLLEWMKIPYTGSPTQPLLLCRSKPLTKSLLSGVGLPTARFLHVSAAPCPPHDLGWPVMVKPASEDGSVGITQDSVVTTQEQLDARIEYLVKTYGGSVLVEQFILGREFHVSLLERDGRLDVLPFSEILFHGSGEAGQWPIISFDAKWRPGTKEFENTPAKNPADVDPELQARVADVVRRAFRATGCRDYARIDLRVDATGQPYILEVNPNPCIAPMGGLEAALVSAKIPYHEFSLGLVKEALRRGPKPELAENLWNSIGVIPETSTTPPARVRRTRVRPARSTERAKLIAMVEGAPEIPASDKPHLSQCLDRLTRRNRPEGSCVLVLPEGFAVVERNERHSGVSMLTYLHVNTSAREEGVGDDLLRAVEAFTQQHGQRLVQADFSTAPAYSYLRQLLTHHEYLQMADIPEYHADSMAQITYVRYLPAPAATADSITGATAPADA